MPSRLSRWWHRLQADGDSTKDDRPVRQRPQSEVLVLPAFVEGGRAGDRGGRSSDHQRRRRSSYDRQSLLIGDLQNVEPVEFWRKDAPPRDDSRMMMFSSTPPRKTPRPLSAGLHSRDRRSEEDQDLAAPFHALQLNPRDSPSSTAQGLVGQEFDVPPRASSLRFRASNDPLDGSPRSPRRVGRQSHDEAAMRSYSPSRRKPVVPARTQPANSTPGLVLAEGSPDAFTASERTTDKTASEPVNLPVVQASNSALAKPAETTENSPSHSTRSHGDMPALVQDGLSSASKESIDAIEDQPPIKIGSKGMGDLPVTGVDTTVNKTWLPAVTHEVVDQHFHEIREEHITRDIHTYDVFHRILPVVDVQVLPARHFMLNEDGSKVEISEDEIPGRTESHQDWVIAETKTRPLEDRPIGPLRFTARKFEGDDGDYREWVGEDGVPRSETTWVHQPQIVCGECLAGNV